MWQKFLAKLKRAHHSWTITVNVIIALVAANLDSIAAFFPSIQPYVSATWYGRAMIAVAVANLALRFKTTKPLEAR